MAVGLAVAATACNQARNPQSVTATTHNLTIKRHSDVQFGNGNGDAILKSASEILAQDTDAAGASDIACAVELRRAGDVGNFASNAAPKVINNQAGLDSVFAQSADAKMVTAINWCGERRAGMRAAPDREDR